MPESKRPPRSVSPIVTTIIAALAGLLGTGAGAILQGRANLALEQKKFESALILKAIETGDEDKAIHNLLFFIQAGFIQDPSGKIRALAKPTTVAVLPQASAPPGRLVPDIVGLPIRQATAILEKLGFSFVVTRKASSEPPDTVIFQEPVGGNFIPPNAKLTLIVAGGR